MQDIDERIIILILFVVISAFKWISEKIKTRGEQPHEISESLEDVYEDFREEIRQHQTTVQQQPSRAQAPPPLPQAPPSRQTAQSPLPSSRKKVSLSTEQKAAAARFEQLTAHKSTHRKIHSGPNKAIRALLANPHSTRQAIILHEIIGKPKSLRDGVNG